MIRDVWFENSKLLCNPRTDFIAELVSVGDINGDGIDEVVVADMHGIIAVWKDPKLLVTDCRNYNINSGIMTFDNLKWVSMVLINSISTSSFEGGVGVNNDESSNYNQSNTTDGLINSMKNQSNIGDNDDNKESNSSSSSSSSFSSSSITKKDVCVLKLDGYIQIWTWNSEHFVNVFDCMVLDGQLVDLLSFTTSDSTSGSSNNNLVIVERSATYFYTIQTNNKENTNILDYEIVETYKQLLEVHSMDILEDTFMLMSHGSSISVYQFDADFKNLILVPAEASLPLPSTPYIGSFTLRAGRYNTFAAASLDGRFCVCLLKFGDEKNNTNANAKSWSILHSLQTADSLFAISYLHTPYSDVHGTDKFIACSWTGHTYILDINSNSNSNSSKNKDVDKDIDKGVEKTVYCFEGGLLLQRSAVAVFTCGWLGKRNHYKNKNNKNKKSSITDDSTIIYCSTRGDMYAIRQIFTKIAEVAPPKFPYRQYTINREIKEKKVDKSKWQTLVKSAQTFEHLDETTLNSSNICSELWRLPQTQLVEILKKLH